MGKLQNIGAVLSAQRSVIYGVAALLVVLYHAGGAIHMGFLKLFSYGFIGVDIFLFIGAYCLCYSIQRHTLKQFYLNRFLRIYPLWFVLNIIIVPIVGVMWGVKIEWFSLVKIVYSIPVVLPLWTGRGACDWFTASLLQFYLLFPILYKWFARYNNVLLYMVTILFSIFLLENWSFTSHWQMACFVSRFPVFVSGIILFNLIQKKHSCIPLVALSLIGFSYACYRGYVYLQTAMICPVLVVLMAYFFDMVKRCRVVKLMCYPIEKIGNRSLETYYGGWFTGCFSDFYYDNLLGLTIYVFQTLCGAFGLSVINDLIKNKVTKRYLG